MAHITVRLVKLSAYPPAKAAHIQLHPTPHQNQYVKPASPGLLCGQATPHPGNSAPTDSGAQCRLLWTLKPLQPTKPLFLLQRLAGYLLVVQKVYGSQKSGPLEDI